MKNDDFLWLQIWCCIHCNGNWERDKRIHLRTLDNPGWSLTINLKDTKLEDQKFQKVKINRTEHDWVFSAIQDNKFEGRCGPINLSEVLEIFHDWARNFLDDEDKQLLDKYLSKLQIEKDDLMWLQNWYYIHCNGDWEHSFGINLEMLDTPGWLLKINLKDTELETEVFKKVEIAKTEDDWVVCMVRGLQFEGACSLTNLHEVIKIFRKWAENVLKGRDQKRLELLQNKGLHFMVYDDFLWLQNWYHIHCDGDWEHDKGIHVGTIDNPGWSLTVNLEDTELENQKFQKVEINRTEDDWIFCTIRDNKFEGRCGPNNLPEVLKLFRNWAQKF